MGEATVVLTWREEEQQEMGQEEEQKQGQNKEEKE